VNPAAAGGRIHNVQTVEAAKLLILAWTLMKRKEPFDPQRLTSQT
jgi:hypothetical protein